MLLLQIEKTAPADKAVRKKRLSECESRTTDQNYSNNKANIECRTELSKLKEIIESKNELSKLKQT